MKIENGGNPEWLKSLIIGWIELVRNLGVNKSVNNPGRELKILTTPLSLCLFNPVNSKNCTPWN